MTRITRAPAARAPSTCARMNRMPSSTRVLETSIEATVMAGLNCAWQTLASIIVTPA